MPFPWYRRCSIAQPGQTKDSWADGCCPYHDWYVQQFLCGFHWALCWVTDMSWMFCRMLWMKLSHEGTKLYLYPVGGAHNTNWTANPGSIQIAWRCLEYGTLGSCYESTGGQLWAGSSIDIYDDVYCSLTLLEAAKWGNLNSQHTVLMLSIDRAQLFESKPSDCWIYIWVLLDLAPNLCNKNRYAPLGGFIPGPNKPQESQLFSLYWSSSSAHSTNTWPLYLGFSERASFYLTAILLLRNCWWTWACCDSWASWIPWSLWVSWILWAQREKQAG